MFYLFHISFTQALSGFSLAARCASVVNSHLGVLLLNFFREVDWPVRMQHVDVHGSNSLQQGGLDRFYPEASSSRCTKLFSPQMQEREDEASA